MPEAVKYQVFISSTYEDLTAERREVERAILEMGHIPVGMEMFSAADEEQWRIIARNIEQSDYYVVIVAHRYGSVVGDMSYTEKEYRYALEVGVPVLGFIIDPEIEWSPNRVDKEEPAISALTHFKELVASKPVSFWKSPEDLGGKAAIALMKAITANPREGWARAGSRPGLELTEELGRLSAENARLRQQLAEAVSESRTALDRSIAETVATLKSTNREFAYRAVKGGDWIRISDVSLYDLFDAIGPELLGEAEFDHLSYILAFTFKTGDKANMVPANYLRSWLADLNSIDLVQPSTIRHSVNDTGEYWSLTEFGQEVLKWTRKHDLGPALDDPPEDDEGNADPESGDDLG